MNAVIYVAIGGALGSVARYLMASATMSWAVLQWGTRFPVGTLGVNLVGCLLIGLIAGLADKQTLISADIRLFLVTGVMGGFTTFSSFGLETLMLIKGEAFGLAVAYVLASVVLGVALVALGWWLAGQPG